MILNIDNDEEIFQRKASKVTKRIFLAQYPTNIVYPNISSCQHGRERPCKHQIYPTTFCLQRTVILSQCSDKLTTYPYICGTFLETRPSKHTDLDLY